jgi:transposase-like protein
MVIGCLRRWMKQDDDRRRDGLQTNERAELVRLRRELRTAKMESEILRLTAFAKETLPNPKSHVPSSRVIVNIW